MKTPRAVIISDVHYNIHTLELADKAVNLAVKRANKLNVPLIIAGDLHDTKANLRGECVNVILRAFKASTTRIYLVVGNHDRLNEKAPAHALNFLAPFCIIADYGMECSRIPNTYLIPYYHDAEELRAYLKTLPAGSTLIMHQGIQGSDMGDYIQDKSAISKEDVAGFRVISGHYHNRQTIALPSGGTWDYIGNPYTLSYGEANDLPKGFQVLYSDGSLEFIPTNLRKHIVHELEYSPALSLMNTSEDLVWVKITGTKEQLAMVDKKDFKGCRLDLIPLSTSVGIDSPKKLLQPDMLDYFIDNLSNTSDDKKTRIKKLWRGL